MKSISTEGGWEVECHYYGKGCETDYYYAGRDGRWL